MQENTNWSRSSRDSSMQWEFTIKNKSLQSKKKKWMMILHLTLNVSNRYNRKRVQWWILHWIHTVLCVCLCFLWFEGMSCYRSSFSSWKRQKEGLTCSHAAIRPSVCSDGLTTACSLKSGLRLQRLSSSLATSVSSLKRTASSWTTWH